MPVKKLLLSIAADLHCSMQSVIKGPYTQQELLVLLPIFYSSPDCSRHAQADQTSALSLPPHHPKTYANASATLTAQNGCPLPPSGKDNLTPAAQKNGTSHLERTPESESNFLSEWHCGLTSCPGSRLSGSSGKAGPPTETSATN